MPKKMTGKRADISREASGQISAPSYAPLSRKCPYNEKVPEILAGTPRSARKNEKNCAIASFYGEQSIYQVSKQDNEWFSQKKILNIDPN